MVSREIVQIGDSWSNLLRLGIKVTKRRYHAHNTW